MKTGRKQLKKGEVKPTQKSFLEDGNKLIEQIYNEKEGCSFAVWDGKKTEYLNSYTINNEVFKPIMGEDVTKKVVLLSSEASEYETEEQLAEQIEQFIRKWVGLSEQFYKVATWYILTSWVYDRYDTINYLRALGDTGTGKSRFIDTIGGLCYKFIKISGAASPAAAFRIHEKWRGTIAIEEGDLKESDETNDIIKWLNCGFERNNPIIRCDKNDPKKLDFFDPFGPKIIATRREFQDTATEARCLTERMIQDGSKADTKTDEFYRERQEIRNKLLLFRFRNYHKVDIKKVLDYDLTSLEPRLRQASRPFLAMVWDKPKLMENFKLFLQDYNKELIEIRAGSYVGQIINIIANYIVEGKDLITCQDIKDKIGMDKVTSKSIGKQLRSLKIVLEPKKVDGKTKKIIKLEVELFSIVFKRYVVEEDVLKDLTQKGYSVTEVTEHMRTNKLSNQPKLDVFIAEVTETSPTQCDGNFGNSVTQNEEIIETNSKTQDIETLLSFIKAHQTTPKPNEEVVLACLEQLGYDYTFLVELREKGVLIELPARHWMVLE